MKTKVLFTTLLLCVTGFAQVVHLTPVPKIQFFDQNGKPLAGGFVYTYAAGTTTPLATYTDFTGVAANQNPVHLDAGGYANIWLTDGSSYKFLLQNSAHVQQYVIDGISNPNPAGSTFDPASPPPIGNVLPNAIDGTVITAHSRFVGNLTGNVTGNLGGNVVGNLTGNVTGNLTGDVNGNIGTINPQRGTFTDVIATFALHGILLGNVFGNVTGNVTGNLTGNADTATNAVNAVTATNAHNLIGFQTADYGATCSTGNTAYATCNSTYTIPIAYADTSYRVTCSLIGSLTGFPSLFTINRISGSQISITIVNGTSSGAAVSSASEVNCFFFHP